MSWRVSPSRVATVLTAIALSLTTLSLVGFYAKHVFGHDHILGFVPLFDIDEEANVPSWFSSVLLLICAGLLWAHARHAQESSDPHRRGWAGLAGIFLFASLDETAAIHERVGALLKGVRGLHPSLYFAWVVPAIALLIVFALVYARFVFALPKPTRVRFIVAGVLYVGGAVGIEMLGGNHASRYGMKTPGFGLLTHAEELCEMLGLVLFIYGLMRSAEERFAEIRVTIESTGVPATQAAARGSFRPRALSGAPPS